MKYPASLNTRCLGGEMLGQAGGGYQGVLGLGSWRVKINHKREPAGQEKFFLPQL